MAKIEQGLVLLGAVIALAVPLRDARAACTPPNCALDLEASGAYVSLGSTSALGLPVFTLEAWFQRQGTGSSASTGTGGVSAIPLVSKGRGEADRDSRDRNWFLGIRASDGVLVADFEEGTSGSSPGVNHPIAGATPIASGVWHHAAASFDGTTWRLYLNGVEDATSTVGQPARSDSIQHAALGTALRANVAETPRTSEFSVEGDRGIYDGDRDGSARDGSGGEGDAATVQRRVQAACAARSFAGASSG